MKKTILITGGGRGIGAATARLLAHLSGLCGVVAYPLCQPLLQGFCTLRQ